MKTTLIICAKNEEKIIGCFIEQFLALTLFILFLPFFIILLVFVKVSSKGPFIFRQARMGKNRKKFFIYKIRTMAVDAESQKLKVKSQNEADGPVFKIRNDPRYTKIGRWLSRTGLDEVPQLINIIKGEMSFVGPRPLPVGEAEKIPKKYEKRFSVKPGITSLWVVAGARHDSFDRWMRQDLEYIKKKNLIYDIYICSQTILMLLKLLWQNI